MGTIIEANFSVPSMPRLITNGLIIIVKISSYLTKRYNKKKPQVTSDKLRYCLSVGNWFVVTEKPRLGVTINICMYVIKHKP